MLRIKRLIWSLSAGVILACLFATPVIFASSGGGEEGVVDHAELFAVTFLYLALIVIMGKVGGLVERIKQPAVLGELVVGIILGNLGLLGLHILDPIKDNLLIAFLAELGVVILLFQIGLESNLKEMKKVGIKAFLVAVIGVVCPFVLGAWVVGPWLLPGLDFNVYLFLGATLTATSVGITARVFQDLGKIKTKEAQIVLGAAVIDDIIGLLILAVVSGIVSTGHLDAASVGIISLKALAFLVVSIFAGRWLAPYIGKFFSKIHSGVGMKFGLAIALCLVFAYLASAVGLAPIVGAFIAGLFLDPVHFRGFKNFSIVEDVREIMNEVTGDKYKKKVNDTLDKYSHRHVEDLMEGVGRFLVPIFFVYTGFQVKLETLFDPHVLLVALIITVAAFIGKIVAGLAAGKGVNKMIVGVGMIPRGEVGLIFVNVGKALGVVDDKTFSIIVIMVILSTLVAPPILNWLLRRQDSNSGAKPEAPELKEV